MAATISEIISSDSPPAKSRFLEDKKILRRILDDPKATHMTITEAVRTDAELNVSLLKIGVEGIMFNKFALQSHQSRAKQYDREQQLFVDRESNSLRLDEANVQSTTTGTNPNNKPGATNGIS